MFSVFSLKHDIIIFCGLYKYHTLVILPCPQALVDMWPVSLPMHLREPVDEAKGNITT